jgi:ElaA protein
MSEAAALHWTCRAFHELSVTELHDILQLRAEVFVVEQACAFQDIDGTDPQAMHLMGYETARPMTGSTGQLVAYARCFDAGVKFAEASIGRVITRASVRGSGLGHALMRQARQVLVARWGEQPIRIGAQARLKNFYGSHGFVDMQRPYLEDGIEHLEMLWQPANTTSGAHA